MGDNQGSRRDGAEYCAFLPAVQNKLGRNFMERQYGVGIIGTGAIAAFHAIAAEQADGARLVACYSHSPVKCDAFAHDHGDIKSYHDLESFMADDEVEIVMIATPPSAHLEEVLAAVKHRKKAVIVEKPLEINTERCDEMIRLAEENGVMLSGIFQSRFFEASRIIKKAIDEGRFGRITLIDTQFKWLRTQDYFDSVPWHGEKDKVGGGILMNQGIHAIDLLRWFGGDVENVSGRTALLGHKGIDVEDTAAAVLQFRNGAIGIIEGTSASYPGFLKRVEICGTDGSAILEEESIKAWNFREERPGDEEIRQRFAAKTSSGGGASDPMGISANGHIAQLENVVDALNEGREPFITGREAEKAVALIEAIYRSADEGGRVVEL